MSGLFLFFPNLHLPQVDPLFLAESQVTSSWREGSGAKGLLFQLINEHNARLIRHINWGMQRFLCMGCQRVTSKPLSTSVPSTLTALPYIGPSIQSVHHGT